MEIIKQTCVADKHATVLEESSTKPQQMTESVVVPGGHVPAAYPHIQPLRAAFRFDSIDGFGEWRLLISTRADQDLRRFKKKESGLFAIVMKKMKFVRHSTTYFDQWLICKQRTIERSFF